MSGTVVSGTSIEEASEDSARRRVLLGSVAVVIPIAFFGLLIGGAHGVGLTDGSFDSIGTEETSKINVISVSISALVGIQADLTHLLVHRKRSVVREVAIWIWLLQRVIVMVVSPSRLNQ